MAEKIEIVTKEALDHTIKRLSETSYDFVKGQLLDDQEAIFKGATPDTAGTAGLVPTPTQASVIGIFQGATATSDGKAGLVPPPNLINVDRPQSISLFSQPQLKTIINKKIEKEVQCFKAIEEIAENSVYGGAVYCIIGSYSIPASIQSPGEIVNVDLDNYNIENVISKSITLNNNTVFINIIFIPNGNPDVSQYTTDIIFNYVCMVS